MTLDAIIEVKADAGSILAEPDDVDADYVTIMEDPGDIKSDLVNVAGDVSDMTDHVAMLQNAIQVQAGIASTESRNEVNDAPVTLNVQVIQNGSGLSGCLPKPSRSPVYS
jgi:hypothetical protein